MLHPEFQKAIKKHFQCAEFEARLERQISKDKEPTSNFAVEVEVNGERVYWSGWYVGTAAALDALAQVVGYKGSPLDKAVNNA